MDCQLVTPFDKTHHVIKLPISSLSQTPALPPTTLLHWLLIAQFHTTLEAWQCPLFGPITQLQLTSSIQDINQDHQMLIQVSDASVQKNKQSSLAWVFMHNTTTLWKGIGLAPGHADDIYSGQAEPFRLHARLLFLQHYITSYDPSQFTDSPLTCFCDNTRVITNVNDLLSSMILWPNDSMTNDRDVYLAIYNAISNCSPL